MTQKANRPQSQTHSKNAIQQRTRTAPLFEEKRNEFREYYSSNVVFLQSAEKAFRNLIQLILDATHIRPKVSSRVKDREECIKKFQLKYQQQAEKEESDYKIQNYITDIIGIRIVCLYEDQIQQIRDILLENFDKIDETDKTFLINDDIRIFGYKGLHLDLALSEGRLNFKEYSRFKGLRFEVQIRSIVQDAWSEVDHKLKYKKKIPENIQRRIIRMAALFELADQEFVAIKNETMALEQDAADQQQKGQLKEKIVDAISFAALIKKLHPNYNFDDFAIDGFVEELTHQKDDITIGFIENSIHRHRDKVWTYKQYKRKDNVNINPFTEIRHVLYLEDPILFGDMLYPNQENSFVEWLRSNQ